MASRVFFSIVFALLFCNNEVVAQNIPPSGGELTYEYIGSTTNIPYHYAVTLIVYKTADTATRVPLSVVVSSSCFSYQSLSLQAYVPLNVPVTSNGAVLVSPRVNCGDTLNPDSLRLFAYYYADTVVLPGKCSDFEFSYTECCRSSAINNIVQLDSSRLFLGAFLNNMFGPNTSPRFIESPRYLFCKNQEVQMFQWAIEPDGDSLNFGSFPALDSIGSAVNYASGRTANDPIPSATVYSINGFNPTTAGVFTTVLQVQEHRYIPTLRLYVKVGAVIREINFVVRDTCPDYLYASYNGGLIKKDTIYGVRCNDTIISFATNPFRDNVLLSDGSQFRVLGPDLVLRPVIKSSSSSNPALISDSIWLEIYVPPAQNGSFFLYYKNADFYNTCGNKYPDDYLYFVVTDCNTSSSKEADIVSSFSLYPNPTQNKFILETGERLPETITLLDMQGRELKSIHPTSTKSEIDISGFSSGVYLLKVDVGGYEAVRLVQKS